MPKPNPKPRVIKNNTEKNVDKNNKGWCTDDLYFDQEGSLFIANDALAHEIQRILDAWGGQMSMFRDTFPGETDKDGGPIGEHTVNMMCPCGPQGP